MWLIFPAVNTILLLAGAVYVFLFRREFTQFEDTLSQLKISAIQRLVELEIQNAANIQRLADHLGLYDHLPPRGGSGVSPLDFREHEGSAQGASGLCEGRIGQAGGSW